MKIIGKPYSEKPNVRFDEGELEIELSATTPALYSTVSHKKGYLDPESSFSQILGALAHIFSLFPMTYEKSSL